MINNPYAIDEEMSWSDNLSPYSWNEALEHAARHLVQIEGPCSTDGDANGDDLEAILSKYYAYSYKDLEVLRIESSELIQEGSSYNAGPGSNENSEIAAWDYILSQSCIDKSIFKSGGTKEFAIACSCSA